MFTINGKTILAEATAAAKRQQRVGVIASHNPITYRATAPDGTVDYHVGSPNSNYTHAVAGYRPAVTGGSEVVTSTVDGHQFVVNTVARQACWRVISFHKSIDAAKRAATKAAKRGYSDLRVVATVETRRTVCDCAGCR